MRLLITGGGTGGHVYPLLAVLSGLVDEYAVEIATDVRFVGRGASIEERLAKSAGIPYTSLRVGALRTWVPWTLARNLALMVRAVGICGRLLDDFMPQAVLASGGYVSVPAVYAAARRGVPVVIYLPDLEPGWGVRIMSHYSRTVAVSFEEVRRFFTPGQAAVTGYPVRPEFANATREAGLARFGLNSAPPVVTIFGGSQGAHSINQVVRDHLDELLQLAQVIHVSGRQDENWMREGVSGLSPQIAERYHLFGYLDKEMPLALAAADLVIARAGAATLGELPAVGVPAILVPYPFAGKHQERNADFMVRHGAAVKLNNASLSTELLPLIKQLLGDRDALARMSASSRALFHPDAAKAIGRLLI